MFSEEFKENKILQWALGALPFMYFIAFNSWIGDSALTLRAVERFSYRCPPYFQSCSDFYFLQELPWGYSQTILYMLLFGLLVWCAFLVSQKKWHKVQLFLVPVFLWHAISVLFLTDKLSGNYEYYLMSFGLILLFFPHKEFFLKLSLVIFYFLSTVAKIHPSWIEGGYFTSLKTGLPIFPDWSVPFWTNLIILMEMVGAWFLFAKNPLIQRAMLVFFIIFHLYSGILVQYRYPATVLPMLLILFGPWYRHTPPPLDHRAIVGWVFILFLVLFQFSPRFISGDEKLTLEGNKYGLYMFEANHQCVSLATLRRIDGTTRNINGVKNSARQRCNPYNEWFELKQYCERTKGVERIEWTFDHSINGGPFYRIVNTENACSLEYHAFTHNE